MQEAAAQQACEAARAEVAAAQQRTEDLGLQAMIAEEDSELHEQMNRQELQVRLSLQLS